MAADLLGWDLGGANIKATRLHGGVVTDVAQWPCPLWQGLDKLEAVLAQAHARWPDATAPHVWHAVTMTGEMADLFPHREAGVTALAQAMSRHFGERVRCYAGPSGWRTPGQAGAAWREIASANWLATAAVVAARRGQGVLVDIGTTTTDLIPFDGGRERARGRDDAGRLASGELVYHGVVRTPLCALSRRLRVGGTASNVMHEWFATTADVYRLTGELDPLHDAHPTADGGPRTPGATRQRLARMVGLDARDAPDAYWLAHARAWRAAQLAELARNLRRVLRDTGLPPDAPLVGAGCGDFLGRELARRVRRPFLDFAEVAAIPPAHAAWARVCAPSVAVALLLDAALAQDNEETPCGSSSSVAA